MQTIKAEDLQVGMETENGLTVEEVEVFENRVEVSFMFIDPDCGDVEYLPCVISLEEEYNIL